MLLNVLWPNTVLTQHCCFLVICLDFKNLHLCQWRKHSLMEESWWQAHGRGALHGTEGSAQLNAVSRLPRAYLSTGFTHADNTQETRNQGQWQNHRHAEQSPQWIPLVGSPLGDSVRMILWTSKKPKSAMKLTALGISGIWSKATSGATSTSWLWKEVLFQIPWGKTCSSPSSWSQ